MRISYEWLSDFVDLSGITPQDAAEMLTRAGIEVSEVQEVDLTEILVGRVLSQEPHPRSRSPLWVHQVDLGGGRTEQIIAGAPNAVPGALVPVALPGIKVPSGKLVREGFNVGGIAGHGMLCSATELELGEDESGILILNEGRPGQSLAELLPPQAVLVAEVTSNRPDCLGHLGVARELAAACRRDLSRDFMPPFTGGVDPAGQELVTITIEASDLCSRYIGAPLSGVRVGPSPEWMRRRLRAAGLRPINNVVDVTNYVLLEYGQPLHAFDLERLAGAAVTIRRAAQGEDLLCLDQERRQLGTEMLVIADARRPVAVAGVIGGAETAVTEQTTSVLLEAATFDGPSVRATSRRLGLRTDASSRFEKSLPPELALAGARRAAALLAEVAQGSVHREWPDVYPRPQEPVRVRVWPSHVDALLGVHVPLEESETALRRLGFHLRADEEGAWDVLAPVFRLDIAIPEDVVEEIARVYGTDRIPATLPGARQQRWSARPVRNPLDQLRRVLVGAGLYETVTPALVSGRLMEDLGLGERLLRSINPLTEDLDAMRTSIVPSLVGVLATNRSRGRSEVGLFEWGHLYLSIGAGQPEEPMVLTALLSTGSFPDSGRQAFFRAKSILDACAEAVGSPGLDYRRGEGPLFHPGRCTDVFLLGSKIGQLGELHPAVMERFDVAGRATTFEVWLKPLLEAAQPRRARPLARYPAVERDLAVVVAEATPAGALLETIRGSGGALLEEAQAFDEYRGSQVGPERKSVAFSLSFRSAERTLTDREVDQAMAVLAAALEKEHDARVRR